MTSGSRVKFSVVLPTHNSSSTLREVLEAIARTGCESLQVVVADDASTDGSAKIAGEYPVTVVRNETCRGAAPTRNLGASAAEGEIVVFIDSDVVIPPNTFDILGERFRHTEISAVIGLLRPVTRFPDLCSQYKNFYMHYTYMKLPEYVTVFYTSLAAIRRDVFNRVGGFDTAYRSATIEDMDFGVRVTKAGYRILIDPRLQVDHIRRYTFSTLLKTGFHRASGLAKIALRDRLTEKEKSSYVTTSPAFLAGIVLSWLLLLMLLGLVFTGAPVFLATAFASYLLLLFLNAEFLLGLGRHTRVRYTLLGALLLPVDLFVHGLGVVRGVVTYLKGDRY